MAKVKFEGLSIDEILELPDEEMDGLVLCSEPLVIRVGSADVLGQFSINGETLVIELAHIDGGGEGVLPAFASLAKKYARQRNLKEVEWLVHATNCAKPNLKLKKLLERKSFEVNNVVGVGDVYYLKEKV